MAGFSAGLHEVDGSFDLLLVTSKCDADLVEVFVLHQNNSVDSVPSWGVSG